MRYLAFVIATAALFLSSLTADGIEVHFVARNILLGGGFAAVFLIGLAVLYFCILRHY